MKKYIFGLILLVLASACSGQRTRINPITQIKKAPYSYGVLMSRPADSCYAPVARDSFFRLLGQTNDSYTYLNQVSGNDSLRQRFAYWDNINGVYFISSFGGTYFDNVFNKKVSYIKLNDTLLVNYSSDFGNDTIRISPPLKYKMYTATLQQTGTSAPSDYVLDNNIGALTWSRISAGKYKISGTGLLPLNKCWVNLSTHTYAGYSSGYYIQILQFNSDEIEFYTNGLFLAGTDDGYLSTAIEIRVYK